MKQRWLFGGAAALALVAVAACSGKAEVNDGAGGAGASGSGGAASGGSGTGGVDCNCAVGAEYPVCGVDGTTYDAACGEVCVPVAIACPGPCPCDDCGALEEAYADQLALAKACNPAMSVEQCTELVDDALGCPCDTFVNPFNSDAMAALQALKAQWDALQCGAVIDCPPVVCTSPATAFCIPGSGSDGGCQDEGAGSGG